MSSQTERFYQALHIDGLSSSIQAMDQQHKFWYLLKAGEPSLDKLPNPL